MGDAGLEHPANTPVKANVSKPGGAESGALEGENAPDSGAPGPADPELQAIIQAWPTLPMATRTVILALIGATASEADQ